MGIHKFILAAAAAQFVAAPAFAQIGEDPFDQAEPRAQGLSAGAFLRFSFGGADQHAEAPRFGLGVYQDCGRANFGLNSTVGSCGSSNLRGFELTSPLDFDGSLTLAATGPFGRRNLLGWAPETGVFGFQADGAPQAQGGIDWTWVAIGVVTVGAIVAATQDDDDTSCPTNQTRDPQTGQCVSIAS